MSDTAAALLVVGAVLELFGIVLVASPDLVPGTMRLVRWIRPRWRRVENRVRRLLRLPVRAITYEDFATVTMKMHASATAEVGIDPHASLEDKVAFLLRRHSETERSLNTLAQRLTAVETDTPTRIAELRTEMETHIERRLESAKEDYRVARVGGALVLALGLAMTTAANFAA